MREGWKHHELKLEAAHYHQDRGKHQVTTDEVEDALTDSRRYQKRIGSRGGMRRYQIIAKTTAGRMLRIILDADENGEVTPVTAFDAPYTDHKLYHKKQR